MGLYCMLYKGKTKKQMNKKQIIDKIVNDLPSRDLRSRMTNEEWYGWFEECWDKATDLKGRQVPTPPPVRTIKGNVYNNK